jgi:hypothetical protein
LKRVIGVTLAVIVVFGGVLMARFPAAWAATWLPEPIHCAELTGTVWRGACVGLVLRSIPLGELSWELQPSALVRGKLGAQMLIAGTAVNARARIDKGLSGPLGARDLHGSFPLDPTLIPDLPPGLRGSVQADLGVLVLQDKQIERIEGRLEVRDLEQRDGARYSLGSYAVEFPQGSGASGEPLGTVKDLGGPVAFDGRLRLTREPGYEIEGLIAARAEAGSEIKRAIEFLGRPDAAGRRPFSIAGTY